MDTGSVIYTLYVSISILALILTYLEQKQLPSSSQLLIMVGYGFCLIWPIAIIAMAMWRFVFSTVSISRAPFLNGKRM